MEKTFTKQELDTYLAISKEVAKTPFFGSIMPRFEALKEKLDPEDREFYADGLTAAVKDYIEAIYQGQEADAWRFSCHNAIVAKLPPLNRLAVRCGMEPIFMPADEGKFERLLEKLNQGLPRGKSLAAVLPQDLWDLREEVRVFAEVFYFEVVMAASDDKALNRLWNAKTMAYLRSIGA